LIEDKQEDVDDYNAIEPETQYDDSKMFAEKGNLSAG